MPPATPEARARATIDALLAAAGWAVQDLKHANLHAARGVAIREFRLNTGYGAADYLLYVDGKACGVIKKIKRQSANGRVFACSYAVGRKIVRSFGALV